MRMMKKLLLAASFVGVMGTLGFAGVASAAVTVTPSGDNGDNIAITDDTEGIEKVTVKAGSTELYSGAIADASFSIKAKAAEKSVTSTISTLEIKTENSDGTVTNTETYTLSKPLSILTVKTEDPNKGTIGAGATTGVSEFSDYMYQGETRSISAEGSDPFKFSKWDDGNTQSPRTITMESSNITRTATFARFAPDSITLIGTVDGTKYEDELTMNVNKQVKFTYAFSPSGTYKSKMISLEPDMEGYFSSTGTGNTYKAKKKTEDGEYVTWTLTMGYSDDGGSTYDYELTSSIDIEITGESTSDVTKITTKDFKDYIVEDYTMKFTCGDFSEADEVKWSASTGNDYVDNIKVSKSDNGTKRTVEVKFKDKLDDGSDTATVKLSCKVNGSEVTIDSDSAKDKEITVYSRRPSATYADRAISYKAEGKVYTGTTSGEDDNNKDATVTDVGSVSGVRLQVFAGDSSLGYVYKDTKSLGQKETISATILEGVVVGQSSKFTGDSQEVKFRVFPCNSDAKFNKEIYKDVTSTVYKITVVDDAGATVATYYGLEGQKIDTSGTTALKEAKSFLDSTGVTATSIVVSSDTAKNKYTAVLGANKGLDRVPKTGQNNLFVYVMIAVVCAAAVGVMYVYNKKAKNNI